MEYTGKLITGDFEDNTMTFEIEGEMTLQAGRYRIVQIEVGNQVKNNVDLADVVGRSEQLVCDHQKIEHIDNFSDRMECTTCGKRF
jgi:hypothetical protein